MRETLVSTSADLRPFYLLGGFFQACCVQTQLTVNLRGFRALSGAIKDFPQSCFFIDDS